MTNSEKFDKLYEILGNPGKEEKPWYSPSTNNEWTSGYQPRYHKIISTAKQNEAADAVLSHELSHATGPLSANRSKWLRIPWMQANVLSNNQLIHGPLQLIGGAAGNAISGISGLIQLIEEGQANLRGALALKKLQGKLTKQNLKTYGVSMGSYLGSNIFSKLGLPKIQQQILDTLAPGYAKQNKVLLDYLTPDKKS